MLFVLTTVTIAPDQNEFYESEFNKLSALVRINEPGLILYEVGKSRDDSQIYRGVEVYRDEEAFAAHQNAPWVQEAWRQLAHCIADIQIAIHDAV